MTNIDQNNLKMNTNLLLTTLFLLYATYANATIYRVNNNPEVDADFTNITDAVAGSSNGDTLHIEASNTYYAGATVTKKLTLIGPGIFVTDHDSTQALGKQAVMEGNIILGTDSIMIKGLMFYSVITTNGNRDYITIEGNYFNNYSTTPSYFIYFQHLGSNISIRENWLVHNSNNPIALIRFNGLSSGIVIENNFIYCTDDRYAIQIGATSSAIIQNNIINGGLILNNTIFKNNILTGADNVSFTSSNEDYNLCNGTQFNGTNSIQSVDMNTVFQTYPIANEQDAELAGGSPAIGAGEGGTDCGIYGGAKPYRYPNMPEVPSIYEFTGPAEAPPAGTISISFESKTHN